MQLVTSPVLQCDKAHIHSCFSNANIVYVCTRQKLWTNAVFVVVVVTTVARRYAAAANTERHVA